MALWEKLLLGGEVENHNASTFNYTACSQYEKYVCVENKGAKFVLYPFWFMKL